MDVNVKVKTKMFSIFIKMIEIFQHFQQKYFEIILSCFYRANFFVIVRNYLCLKCVTWYIFIWTVLCKVFTNKMYFLLLNNFNFAGNF